MDEKQQQVISCKVSDDQAEVIKARAAALGISVSEYVRNRAVGADDTSTTSFETLLRQVLYVVARVHAAVYSIAETAGTVSTDRLHEIYDECAREGMRYLEELPNAIAKVQARITAQTTPAPTTAEKKVA